MEVRTMKRVCSGAVVMTMLLGAVQAGAQAPTYQFPDPTVLVGPGSWIGVRVRDLTGDESKQANVDSPAGVFVESVDPGTPAEKAGIQRADIFIEFDGERVRSVRGFTRQVTETPPRRTVKAVVVRSGARRTVEITPQAGRLDAQDLGRGLPGIQPAPRQPLPPPQFGTPRYGNYIGVTLETVQGQLADYFGVPAGVLISAVDLDSPASRAGLKAGDVITAAAGQTVRSPADVSSAMRGARPGSKLELKIVRDRKEMSMAVDLSTIVPTLL
jgi:serine protease Do